MKEPAKAAQSYQMSAAEDATIYRRVTCTVYCQAVSYLLETYATGVSVAEAEADILNYKQPENLSAIPY